jgi:hypothetical protein
VAMAKSSSEATTTCQCNGRVEGKMGRDSGVGFSKHFGTLNGHILIYPQLWLLIPRSPPII